MTLFKCINTTGVDIDIDKVIALEVPDQNPDTITNNSMASRQPAGGFRALPGAMGAAGAVSSDNANINLPDYTAVYQTPTGWTELSNKMSAPAACGVVMNKSVVLLGEIDRAGIPGAIYYASSTEGSLDTIPPVPVTESDPLNEQWVRVIGVQVNATRMLVRPDVIPFRPVPVAMCQGDKGFNYRLARYGAF